MQTEIALSSTKRKYTGMSYAIRKVIPTINFLQDMKDKGFLVSKKSQKYILKYTKIIVEQLICQRDTSTDLIRNILTLNFTIFATTLTRD